MKVIGTVSVSPVASVAGSAGDAVPELNSPVPVLTAVTVTAVVAVSVAVSVAEEPTPTSLNWTGVVVSAAVVGWPKP